MTTPAALPVRVRFAQVVSWPLYRFWLAGDKAMKLHDRIMRWGQRPDLLAIEEAKRRAEAN